MQDDRGKKPVTGTEKPPGTAPLSGDTMISDAKKHQLRRTMASPTTGARGNAVRGKLAEWNPGCVAGRLVRRRTSADRHFGYQNALLCDSWYRLNFVEACSSPLQDA